MMGFAKDLQDVTDHSPAVSKITFFNTPVRYSDIENKDVTEDSMDLCARVISVFKCHKACLLTAASSISVAAKLDGSISTLFLKQSLEELGTGQTMAFFELAPLSLLLIVISALYISTIGYKLLPDEPRNTLDASYSK